jgi:hypothetical protein
MMCRVELSYKFTERPLISQMVLLYGLTLTACWMWRASLRSECLSVFRTPTLAALLIVNGSRCLLSGAFRMMQHCGSPSILHVVAHKLSLKHLCVLVTLSDCYSLQGMRLIKGDHCACPQVCHVIKHCKLRVIFVLRALASSMTPVSRLR